MNILMGMRYLVLAIAALAMVIGVLAMAGFVVPKYFPEQYSSIIGAVVFLYGAFRFALTFFSNRTLKRDEE